MEQSLESLIDEVTSLGYLINNLFQLQDGTWQANLRQEEPVGIWTCTSWCKADSPYEALLKAYQNAMLKEDQKQTRRVALLRKPAKKQLRIRS